MARRKSEIATIDPTPEAEQKSSVSHHCGETPTLRNRRGKHLTRKKSGRSQNHIQSAEPLACRVSVSGRTRAQTKQQQQAESRSSRGGKQYKRQETKENPIFSSISSSSAHSISRTVSTVAATTSRGTPSSGQGPATRSRLREKVRIETPDSSSNYGDNLAEVERRQEVVPGAGRNAWDYVGDLHVEGRRRHDNVEEENRHDIYAADEEVRRDKRDDEREEEEGPKEENGDDNGDSDADSNASGDEDDEGENGDENNEREWEVEGCRCTSTWSCGGHAGQRCAGPSASTPKLGGKRRLASFNGFDEGDDMSLSKRSCHEKSRQSLRPLFDLKFGGAGSSVKPARQRIPSREHPPHRLQQWLDMFKSWSNAERMMALDDLILLCEPSQVRHMMQIIEPQFQRDFISLLPKELALYVLSFLEPRDLLRAAQTCRYWHVLCEDNLLWREKCREEGIDETLVYGSRLRRRPGQHSPCKALYMRQSQIERNWRRGASKSPKILKGHDDHVITCLEFCGHRIVSGSDDNTLKVWSVLSGKCLRTLVGHTGGVWSSQMSGNIIISGSTDRTLKVWNADTGACKHTLYGHTSTVRCMSLCGNRVVSGSRDATLRVWDIETGQCLHVLMGHVAAVRCVQFDGRRVVSGAYDYTVRVWDPETETCLHTLQGHSNRVYSLQFDGVHVVSGSLDTSIRVWDVESGACLHTLIGHQSLTSGLELKDNILVSGNADSTVKVWDITTGQCLQTLQGTNKHQSAVTCLQFSKKFVITSSDDGTVKIWDLKTGDFLRNLVSLDSGGSGGVVWRLRCSNTKLVCAVGSRNGTEETKLMVIDFDVEEKRIA